MIRVDTIDAEVELKEICDFLKKYSIKYWLSSGTLLGIYRDNAFLKDDTDIDISIMGEDKETLLSYLPREYNVEIVREYDGVVSKIVVNSSRDVWIDFTLYYEYGDELVSRYSGGTWVLPKDRFKKLESIKFKGRKFACPNPEWYLERRFKDWKTPIHKGDKEWGYFAKNDFLRGKYYANL